MSGLNDLEDVVGGVIPYNKYTRLNKDITPDCVMFHEV